MSKRAKQYFLGETALSNAQAEVFVREYTRLSSNADPIGTAEAIERGRKVHQAAKDGHAATHGTDAEKQARWAGYRATYAQIKARNPYLLHEDICRQTAAKHAVCLRTIKRHCPRK